MKVYFLQSGDSGPVKIGYTSELRLRVSALLTGNPEGLRPIRLIEGGPLIEAWLHRHFAAQRLRGEWFEFSPDMLTVQIPGNLLAADKMRVGGALRTDAQSEIHDLISRATILMPGSRAQQIAHLAEILELDTQRVSSFFYSKARSVNTIEAERIRTRCRLLIRRLAKSHAKYEAKRAAIVARLRGPAAVVALGAVRLNSQIREFRAEAPAFMARLAPKPLPMEMPPTLKPRARK